MKQILTTIEAYPSFLWRPNYWFFFLFFTFTVTEEGLAKCSQGSYLNLCGHCVGGTTGKNESEGFDRCRICDGQSECVGCDGAINTLKRDSCGNCLTLQSEKWNDCRKIDRVYPSVIDLSLDKDVVSVTLTGAGLKSTFLNSTKCLVEPFESQSDNPEIKEITSEENYIQLKILLTESTGNYRIGCTGIGGFAELKIADSRKLNVLKVNPAELQIDEIAEFELDVADSKMSATIEMCWCFVKTREELFTLVARRKTETSFVCSGYMPAEPGTAYVGIVANEEAAFYENGKRAKFTVRAKPPVPESAEYNFDMQYIVVQFDQNIRIGECNGTFSPETQRALGHGFTCTVVCDKLYLNLGVEPELIDSLTIVGNNSIRRAGPVETELSPNMDPTVVWVSKGKVMPPIVTLSAPSAVCPNEESQPFVRITASTLSNQRLYYNWTILPTKEWKGKNQRENLLAWKSIRAIEAEIKTALIANDDIYLGRKNLLPGVKYSINLSSTNPLQKFSRRDLTAFFQIQKTAKLSVTVETFPSPSIIIAEANIISCRKEEQNLQRFRWMIDEKVVPVEGKILMVPNMTPGDYNVSCTVFDEQTNEILGAGWAIAQVVKVSGKVFIFPTEAVFGTMDDIVLLGYNEESQFQWTCRTLQNEECIAVGRKSQPIHDIINMTTSTIKIPAGTLPVGRYIWTLHGTENTTAIVIISSRIPPKINIIPPKLKIDSTKPISLNAEVERLKKGCKIRWKTIHRKGYSYFNLESLGLGNTIQVGEDDLMTNEREASLVVPTSRKNWKGLIGNGMYLFRLESICPEPTPEAHSDVTLFVNMPPSSSDIIVVPKNGDALVTKFVIQFSQGRDSINDYPLIYSLSYRDEMNDEISLVRRISPKFDTFLPPGKITVRVKTCDKWESCSELSQTVTVGELLNLPSQIIENLGREIRNLVLSGDTVEGYGKAIVAFKTLSKKSDMKEALLKISSTTESAVRERIRDLSEKLKSDRKPIKICYEFLEQSVSSLKYFPETEEMVKMLKNFKRLITEYSEMEVRDREICPKQKEPEITHNITNATLELYDRNLGNSNEASMPEKRVEEKRRKFVNHINVDVGVGLSGESSLSPEGESTKKTRMFQFSEESILPYSKNRSKRSSENELGDFGVNEGTVQAIFKLHSKIIEQSNEKSNWEDFLVDVRKYMIELCTHIQDFMKPPFLIESTVVTLEVKKLLQSDLKKEVSVVSTPSAKLKFNFKYLPRKTCTAIARYHRDFTGNETSPRVSDIYEVRIIKNGTFKNNFKDDIKSMILTMPIYSNTSLDNLSCMVWKNETGWKQQCMVKATTNSTVLCSCKDPGIFAVFSTNTTINSTIIEKAVTPTVIPVTDVNFHATNSKMEVSMNSTLILISTTTAPIIWNSTIKNGHPETIKAFTVSTSQFVTTTSTLTTATSKQGDILKSAIQNISSIRTNKSVHISGTFKINEDYDKVVGKNTTLFTENLKIQIAEQLKINLKVIANIIVRPGSIVVTVQFIDTEETRAEDAIKELVIKLHEGTLRITGSNATVLNIPRQDLKVKIGSILTRNTGRLRMITYGVITGTCFAIFSFAVGATYFRRKRRRVPLILPNLSIDDHPSYRQFSNEFSLDGSSASLAIYRCDHPFETETVQ